MLQNEQPSEPSPPLGQIRVTPEELNQAVTAIETRKEKEAGTIPIEDAVSHLSLDATPEEIWAEVKAQRDAEAERQARSAQSFNRQQPFQAVYGPPQTQTVKPSRGKRRWWPRLFPLLILFFIIRGAGVLPPVGHIHHPSPPAMTATLASIPDGKEFYCDTATLVQVSEGKGLPRLHVDASDRFDNSWTLVKNAGHIYLHAYTLPFPHDSVQSGQGKPLELFNDDNSGALEGEQTAQTTVRVDGVPLQASGGDDDYSKITVPDFQPDAFTTTSPWR